MAWYWYLITAFLIFDVGVAFGWWIKPDPMDIKSDGDRRSMGTRPLLLVKRIPN